MALWRVPFYREGGNDVEHFAVVEAADEVDAQKAFEEYDEGRDNDASVVDDGIRKLPSKGVIAVGVTPDEDDE